MANERQPLPPSEYSDDLARCTTTDLWTCFRHGQLMKLERGGTSGPLWFKVVKMSKPYKDRGFDAFYLTTEQQVSGILDYWFWQADPVTVNTIRVIHQPRT